MLDNRGHLGDTEQLFGCYKGEIFLTFGYIGDAARFQPVTVSGANKVGWKMHVACLEQDVPIVWDLIKDVFIDERLAQVKVVQPGIIFSTHPIACGRQITIYFYFNPNRNWKGIVSRIEMLLREAYREGNIRRGNFSSCSQVIPNSLFLTYRHDGNSYGEYVSEVDAMRYTLPHNPSECKDNPFVEIVLPPYETMAPNVEPQKT